MKRISIKKEVNSDGEDNERSQEISLNNLGFIKCEGGSRHVKKELTVFDGLPRILHIQPLPDELTEISEVEEVAKSRLQMVPNLKRLKNFTCALCAKKIGTRGGLLYHVKTHFKGRPFKCDICNRSYATKNDFQTHYKRHAGDRFTCDFCSKNFTVKDYLMSHVRANHLPKVIPCTDCKKTKYFSCKAELNRHYSTNRSKLLEKINARFQCKLCKMRFIQLKAYTKHCQDRELLKYKCATCFKKFGCRKLFFEHVAAEKKANFCELCKINVKSLKVHMDMFHKKRICMFCGKYVTMIYSQYFEHQNMCGTEAQVQALGHVCTICDQHFRSRLTLKIHMNKTHAGNFRCAKCSLSYHSEDSLKKHVMRHTTRRNGQKQWTHYKCISCDPPKNFYLKDSFERHFVANHGVGKMVAPRRNFGCENCKRRFASKALLKQHIITKCIIVSQNFLLCHYRNKQGQKHCIPYKCISCNPPRNYHTKNSFDRHFHSSHGVGYNRIGIIFACEKCKRRYARKSILKQHIITKCIGSKNIPRSFTVRQTRARNYINDINE